MTPTTGRLSRAQADFHARVAAARRTGGSPLVIACDETVRLPTSFLAVERDTPSATWRLRNPSAAAAVALDLLGLAPAYGVEVPTEHQVLVADPPCRVHLDADGVLTVSLGTGTGTHPQLAKSMAHDWIEGLAPASVILDLDGVQHLSSVIVAWLIQLLQNCRPAPFRIRNARPTVVNQLRQLRLDALMAVD